MNNNLEKFKEMSSFLNSKPGEKPTDEQIKETISIIEERLEHKSINRFVNAAVKEGYVNALKILDSKEADFNKVNASSLKSVQSRAIASLACDYLAGSCTQVTLLMVPLKDETWGKHKRELQERLGINEDE